MSEIPCRARKVIKNGYSFYIALPQAWKDMHGIKKGQLVVSRIQADGSLRMEVAPK